MPKKTKSKKSKSGVRVRDMKSRKDPKGGFKYRPLATHKIKLQ